MAIESGFHSPSVPGVSRTSRTSANSSLAICVIAVMLLAAGPCHAVRFFVDADATGAGTGANWQDAFVALQPALDIAATGDEIWVACAIYAPSFRLIQSEPRSATFAFRSGVSVFGGFQGGEADLEERNPDPFSNGCVLGGASDPTGFFSIVRVDAVADPVTLDGFSIEGSPALNEFANQGAGMFIRLSSLIGRNLRLNGLSTVTNGPGFGGAVFSDRSDVLLEDVSINECDSGRGGGIAVFGGSVTARRLIVIGSLAGFGGGGAVYVRQDGQFEAEDSSFERNIGNNGAGAADADPGRLTFRRSRFMENRSANGPGGAIRIARTTRLSVDNSLFVGNLARSGGQTGGALSLSGSSSTTLTNSTIAHNEANNGSGVFIGSSASALIQNSIVHGNIVRSGALGEQIEIQGTSAHATVSFSIIQGGFFGSGNLDSDPEFLESPDPGDGTWETLGDNRLGDVRLTGGSPAIDAGNNAADLDGDLPGADTAAEQPFDVNLGPRVLDTPATIDTGIGGPPVIDIGASEFPNEEIFFDGFEE